MSNRKEFTLELDKKKFYCFLDLKSRKNLNITIKANNEIYISKPAQYSLDSLKEYLISNKDWLIKRSKRVNEIANKRNSYLTDDYVVVFNERVYFVDDEDILDKLDDILMKHINDYRKDLDEIIKIYPKVELAKMRGKWGLCIPSHKHIKINKRLVHYPIQCLNYVLVHEYAHLIVGNHSKKFYDLVESIMPDYKVS